MTDPNPTDWRALCAELVEKLDELNCNFNVPNQSALIERSCAALAQPEPLGPTDKELGETYRAAYYACENRQGPAAQVFGLRAVLAKWGRPAIEPVLQQEAK